MSAQPTIQLNSVDLIELEAHLRSCDDSFVPPLSDRVDIQDYAQKLMNKSMRFEAWQENKLIGLVAAYCNDSKLEAAFITSVSVLPRWQGRGVAARLLDKCLAHLQQMGFAIIELEVDSRSRTAFELYRKRGFSVTHANGHTLKMILTAENTKP